MPPPPPIRSCRSTGRGVVAKGPGVVTSFGGPRALCGRRACSRTDELAYWVTRGGCLRRPDGPEVWPNTRVVLGPNEELCVDWRDLGREGVASIAYCIDRPSE
jgi:hypothetical protein